MDAITTLLIYKIVSLIVGTSIVWMGYRLFTLGIFQTSGDLDVLFEKKSHVLFKRAAPGTFFIVFGSLFLITTVWRGFSVTPIAMRSEVFESPKSKNAGNQPSSTATMPNSVPSVQGFDNQDRDQNLFIAQAVNTMAAVSAKDLQADYFKMASRALLETRLSIAKKYLSSQDLDVYYKYDGKLIADIPPLERDAVKRCREWMDKTLE